MDWTLRGRRARITLGALVSVSAMAALMPSAAYSVTSGSPLTAPANYPYHCDYRWAAGNFGPGGQQQYEPILIGPSTCSIWQRGSSLQNTHLVPGKGKVTVARVKSGPNPAPVSIGTVRRYEGLNQQGMLVQTCCFGVSQTSVVNPTPNAVTEIPVNLTVDTQTYDPRQPSRAGFHDIVVVNIHGDSGTLPMSDYGGPKPFGTTVPADDPGAYWYFPKFEPSTDNQNQWFANGFEVLMNFDWCPGTSTRQAGGCATQGPGAGGGGPGGTTTPTPPRTQLPVVAKPPAAAQVRSRRLTLKGKSVRVSVRCTASTTCSGTVRLRTRGTKKSTVLARKKVRVRAGRSSTVKLTLSAKNRSRVNRAKKGLKVRVEVDLGSKGKVSRNMTLKRAK